MVTQKCILTVCDFLKKLCCAYRLLNPTEGGHICPPMKTFTVTCVDGFVWPCCIPLPPSPHHILWTNQCPL